MPVSADPVSGDEAGRPLVLDGVGHSVFDRGVEKPVLALLSHTFDAGRFHVVGGPGDVGKRALLSILSLGVRPTRGTVRWGEHDLSGFRPAQQADWRRRHLGLIVQTSRLVGVMTVREHIRLAASIRGKPEALAEGLATLVALGMGEKLRQLPAQLSGGDKQRLAIAQALCARPAVLIADEPTAALDRSTTALVSRTLRAFARDRGAVVICVSHDRVVMDSADNVLILDKA